MVADDEQIGQRTGHEEAMGVLLQTAIAHLGKAEHPLDDPDHMFNPGPHFGLGAVFRPLDLIDNTAVAVAAIGEIPGLGRALPDYRPLAAVSLISPYPGFIAVQQIWQHRAVGDIGRRGHHRLTIAISCGQIELAAGVDLAVAVVVTFALEEPLISDFNTPPLMFL